MKKSLASLIVLGIATIACGVTVRATAPEQYLGGRTIVIFGGDEFIANARGDVEAVGMVVLTAPDLHGAIAIAGEEDGPYEYHCVDDNDNEMVVAIAQGIAADRILYNGEPIVACPHGAILVGFLTDENPNLTIVK